MNEELKLDPSMRNYDINYQPLTSVNCFLGPVIVQCCQSGKEHIVKIKDLSKEDAGPLIPQDFISGSTLVLNFKGKPYPGKFLKFKGKCIGLSSGAILTTVRYSSII